MVAVSHCLCCPLISRAIANIVRDRHGHEIGVLTCRALPIVGYGVCLCLVYRLEWILYRILVPLSDHVLGLLSLHVVLLENFELLFR